MKVSDFKDTQQISGTALSTVVFINPSKKSRRNIRRVFMEQSGNITIFNIPGTFFGNIPRNFIGNFSRIFWEYTMGMFHEYSANIYLPGG